ncbi:MAG: collagen-like protein, partial [Clostridia bacterium]|nr:collagen-like protein [Clostridia bacterium]
MINENIRLVAGAARRWRLSLVREDSSPVDLSAYRFYGGAASRYRKEFRTMETVSTAPDEVILQLPPLPYGERWHHQIYMQDSATSREWLILSGSIDVLERLGEDAAASTIAEAESYLRCTLSSTTDELEGTFLEAGPRGPQGEQGPKGDKG